MSISSTPLLRLLLPLVAGIAVGEWGFDMLNGQSLSQWLLLGAVLLLLLGMMLTRRMAPFCLLLTPFLLGILLLFKARQSQQVEWSQQPQTYRAIVSDTPKRSAHTYRVRLRTLLSTGNSPQIEATLQHKSCSLQVGQQVFIHTIITPPSPLRNPGEPNRAMQLRHQGISGQAFADSSHWTLAPPPQQLTLREKALCFRSQLLSRYQAHFSSREVAHLAAMTLGDRSHLDNNTRQLYADAGSSHLLALSGLHLGILYLLYQWSIMQRAKRSGRSLQLVATLCSLLLIWAFAFVAGIPLSLLRAALMFSLAQIFGLWGRSSHAFHSLCLAALLMLLWQPQWLFDVGFQLSYLAVAGIMLLQPLMPRFPLHPVSQREAQLWGKFATPRYAYLPLQLLQRVWKVLLISFCAQCATAPLVAYYFNVVPLVGPLASLLALPLLFLLLLGAVCFFLLPPLRSLIAEVMSLMLQWLEESLLTITALPFPKIDLWPSTLTVTLAYALLAWVVFWQQASPRHLRFHRWGCLLLLLSLGFSLAIDQRGERLEEAQIIVYRTKNNCALHLLSPTKQSYLLCSDTLKARQSLATTARRWWRHQGWEVKFLPLHCLRQASGCDSLNGHGYFFAAPHLLSFGRQRWAVIDGSLPYAYPQQALPVDVLLLTRGVKGHLEHLLRHYQPKNLVLCASLSDYYRQRFSLEATKMRLPVHDIELKGAYVKKRDSSESSRSD